MRITLAEITKRFGNITANAGVTLAIRTGEVHCLLGENGAGKSTLIAILAGLQQPDSGVLRVDGREMVIRSPAHARALGLGFVYQRSALVPQFTVGDNLLLGHGGWRLPRKAVAAEWARGGAEFLPDVALATPLAALTLGQRQLLEIYKTLQAGARILVLDEPTSLLPPAAVDRLMALIPRLAARGLGVLFVTHKLREAFAVAQRVSVLRKGVLTASFAREVPARPQDFEAFERTVVALMFDADRAPEVRAVPSTAAPQAAVPQPDTHRASAGPARLPVLRLQGVCTAGDGARALQACTLQIAAGEILGIAGMEGSSQQALAEVIAGQRTVTAGHLWLGDTQITALGVAARQTLGVRYISDDRGGEGTLATLSVALNLLLKRLGAPPFWRHGLPRRGAMRAHADALIARHRIAGASAWAPAGGLSGGNLQKLVFARELDGAPRLLVANKPTYGLDLAAVEHAHRLLRAFARSGGAVLLISNELAELQALSDRVAVLTAGRLGAPVDSHAPHFMDALRSALVR